MKKIVALNPLADLLQSSERKTTDVINPSQIHSPVQTQVSVKPTDRKVKEDPRLKRHLTLGTGVGAFFLGPIGAFAGGILGSIFTDKKPNSPYKKYILLPPTIGNGVKGGMLGSLPISLAIIGYGVFSALTGGLSIVGLALWSAFALGWMALCGLCGGISAGLIRYLKKAEIQGK